MRPEPDGPPQARQQASSQKRKLAAILHADVVAFSRLMGEDDTGTHQALGRLRQAVDPLIVAQNGRIVGTAGDSLLADFSSVVDALNCAVEMQQAARAINEPIPSERRLELRIGVNLGDVIVDGDNIFGDGINIAARLQALAKPGTICISQTVYEQVKNKLNFRYHSLGSHRVKNIVEPVRAYAVEVAATARRRRRRRWPLVAATGGAAIVAAGLSVWALHADVGRHLIRVWLRGQARRSGDPCLSGSDSRRARQSQYCRSRTCRVMPPMISSVTGSPKTSLPRSAVSRTCSSSRNPPASLSRTRKARPAEIGRLLNARYLLDGSIRRSGNRVRVGVQLIEATTGRLVWSETYNAEIDDIFAVQDTIAKSVVGAAAVELTRFERERALAKPTSNLAAYEYVLRGRGALSHDTRDSNDEAIGLFQRAIDLDPNYADAYAALGFAYFEAVVSGWSEFRADDLERAEALAQKALALDPATTRAYHVLSVINLFRKRYDLALAQIDRALEFNPSDADNYAYRGSILVWAGRAAEALPWLEGALRFDRANGFAATKLCMAYYFLRRYTEAVDACDRGISRNPGRAIHR